MKHYGLNERLASIGSNVFIRYRFLWLILILIVVIFCGLGLGNLKMDSSNEDFLPETDVLHDQNDRFKDIFGNEKFVFILVDSEDLFSGPVLKGLAKLEKDLERRLPFVEEVMSITNIEFIDAVDDRLIIEELVGDTIPSDDKSLQSIREKVLSSHLYVNRIITADARYTGMLIRFKRMPEKVWVKADKGFTPLDQAGWPDEKIIMAEDIFLNPDDTLKAAAAEVDDPNKLIAPALKVILKENRHPGYTLTATGLPVSDFESDRMTTEEGGRIGLIAVLISFIILIFLFRGPVGVAAPILVIIITMIILFGLMGWIGIPVSIVTMIVGPLLVVISISYSIHFLNHFKTSFKINGDRKESVRYTYFNSTWPCFLTALTTSIGFTSFLVVPMKPIRHLGLICGFGVLLSYFLVLLIVPILSSFGKNKAVKQPSGSEEIKSSRMAPAMERWGRWILKVKVPVLILFAVIALLSVFFITRVKVETDFTEIMGERVGYVRDVRYVTDRLGALYSYELMIDLPEPNMAEQPQVLEALDKIAGEAQKMKSSKNVMSLVDIIKELNMVMHNRDKEFYKIPGSRDLIAQYMLLYEMSGGDNLNDWVDYDNQVLRVSVQVSSSTTAIQQEIDHLLVMGKELFPEGTAITAVGDSPIMLRMIQLLTQGQVWSFMIAFILIAIVMIIILRSFSGGLISLIPNMLPVVATAGLMGALGINLDMVTVMVAPMLIGIAVDDTVHYLVHFKQELTGTKSYPTAVGDTFKKVGYALLFTSIVLSAGFGVFGLSIVRSNIHMGLLAAFGIIMALAADFCLCPILLVLLKPFKQGRQSVKPDKPANG